MVPVGATPKESILRQYWRIFWTRRWTIALVMVVAMLAGLAIGMLSQRQYAATVTLEIARQSARIIGNDEDTQPRGGGSDQEFYQTQYALLKSRSIAEMVVRDLRLASNSDFLNDYKADSNNSIGRLSQQERERAAVGKIMNNLEVIPVRLSSVVGVRYISPNPDMAARIANSVAENFIESNLARRMQASAYARQFLESRLGQQRQRLEESERQAVGYAAQQHIINIAPTSRDPQTPAQEMSLTQANLAALNQALSEATAARIVAESRARAGGGTATAVTLQNSAVNNLRQRRAELNGEYQRQLSAFGPEYPVVAAQRAQINELDRQIQNETARISQGVGQDLQGQLRQAQATEQNLSGQVERLKAELVDQRRRAIQYNIYQRDVDTNRGLYDALLQRYKEVGIAGGVGTNNVSIVDQATVPQSPFKPNIPVILLVALVIGGVLGAGAALILEQLQESTILPAEFQEKLGVPLLGSVPRLGKDEDAWTALGDAKAPMTEAYFSILTGLQFSTSHGMPKTLLVTSTQPGEGKSTTSLALARALARVGEKVLLIDADLRNPSLHRTLELPNEIGLSSLLVSDTAPLAPLVRKTPTANLSLLTVGQIPPNPAELLSGPGMERVLADATAQFDHVILDGPPILGLADAPLLARSVEGTAFVLEAGRTRATQARQALDRMFAIRAVIVGAVLTKFDTRHYGYGYGYGYDYAYGK